jgi:hypothetical protein
MMISAIYAGAENNRRLRTGIAFGHLVLHDHCAGNGVYCACELDQQSVAGRLDDPTTIFGYGRINDFTTNRFQGTQRANLVGAHKTGIAGDISRQDSRKSSFDPTAGQ